MKTKEYLELERLPYSSGELDDGQKKITWILNGEQLNGVDIINPGKIGNLNENIYKIETNLITLDKNDRYIWEFVKGVDSDLRDNYIQDAPKDGKRYIRKNGDWYEYVNAIAVFDIRHLRNHHLGVVDITPKVFDNITLMDNIIKIDNYGKYLITVTGKIKSVNKKRVDLFVNDELIDITPALIIDGELSIFANTTYISVNTGDLVEFRVVNTEPEPADENSSTSNIRITFNRVGV